MKKEDVEYYAQEDVDDLQEWIENLTLKQAFFLKETYEQFLITQANETGNAYVH